MLMAGDNPGLLPEPDHRRIQRQIRILLPRLVHHPQRAMTQLIRILPGCCHGHRPSGISDPPPDLDSVPQRTPTRIRGVGGVFEGFATIAILIGLGILLAHLGVVDEAGQRTLSTLAFYVASPALMVTVLASSDPAKALSGTLPATAAAVLVTGFIYIVVALMRREELSATVVGTLCSSYVNAGNLGLPIAAYVLGDPALVAPVLLLQLLFLQPLALTLLDTAVGPNRRTVGRVLRKPLTNPITIGSLIGLLLALTDTGLPPVLHDPLGLIGGMAVPSMLLAYGVALRFGPLPGRGVPAAELGLIVGLKMVVQPLAAYLIGRYAVELDTPELLAVTVLSALPTAQNVFIIASRYERSTVLARDAIFVSTLASVPVIVVITALIA